MTNQMRNLYLQFSSNWNIFVHNMLRFILTKISVETLAVTFRWPWLSIWIYRFHSPTWKNFQAKNACNFLASFHTMCLVVANLSYAISFLKHSGNWSPRLVNSIFEQIVGMLHATRFIYIGMKWETHILYAANFKRIPFFSASEWKYIR